MADYWKSNEKHYCDFCKCWTAKNKASIEFHERGKNHQANVKKRLAEIKRNSIDKRKKDETTKQMFAQMEKDALAAVQKDFKGSSQPLGRGDMKKIVEAHADEGSSNSSSATYPWTIMKTPQGFTYYYNAQTGESTWQMPQIIKDLQQKEAKEKAAQEVEKEAKRINDKHNIKDPYREKQAEEQPPEVHSVHPLLGGWSSVSTYTPEDDQVETVTSSNREVKKDEAADTEAKNENETIENPEERQTGKKFKEKMMKACLTAQDETISFKKRKTKNRNVRRRDDDD